MTSITKLKSTDGQDEYDLLHWQYNTLFVLLNRIIDKTFHHALNWQVRHLNEGISTQFKCTCSHEIHWKLASFIHIQGKNMLRSQIQSYS